MLKKLKEIAAHPYAAPVMETLKGIGIFALKPVGRFIERVREGFDDETYKYESDEKKNRPKLRRMYERLFYTDDSAGVISGIGAFVAALGGGIVAGATGGTGIASMLIWGAAGLGVGAAAGPFLLAGLIAVGAACTGLIIGGAPGLVKGCQIAIEHRKLLKAGGQIAAALPAAPPDFTEALAKALSPFNDLTPEQRAAYVKMMNQQHRDAAKGESEKLLQALDSLPDAERDALLRGLKPRMRDEFEKLAQRDADNSTVLQNEITTGGPIKLKSQKKTSTI